MEWWGWTTWAVALGTGIAGLWLGIRAERRAIKYETLWVSDIRTGTLVLHNRTGEDATRITIRIKGAIPETVEYPMIAKDDLVTIPVRPSGDILPNGVFNIDWVITWTRPRTGRSYKSDETRQQRLWRVIQHSS